MKKKILTLLFALLLIMPISAFAEEKYVSSNLKEAFEDEEITLKNPDYKETDDQVTIYLFRGTGCQFCQGFLNYLNQLTVEHGDKFKLVSYDIWRYKENEKLYANIAEFLGYQMSGVPFIIIGDDVFSGYSEGSNEELYNAIIKEHVKEKEDRYDVMVEYDKHVKEEKIKDFLGKLAFSGVVSLIVTGISSVIIICITNKKTNELKEKIELLERKLEETKPKKENKEIKDNHKKNK